MKRFGILIAVLVLLLVALVSAVGAQPEPCEHGTVSVPAEVESFSVARFTPCAYIVTFETAGRVWAVEGSHAVPLTVEAVPDEGCKIRPIGELTPRRDGYTLAARVRVNRAGCRVVYRLNGQPDGTLWTAFTWDIANPPDE